MSLLPYWNLEGACHYLDPYPECVGTWVAGQPIPPEYATAFSAANALLGQEIVSSRVLADSVNITAEITLADGSVVILRWLAIQGNISDWARRKVEAEVGIMSLLQAHRDTIPSPRVIAKIISNECMCFIMEKLPGNAEADFITQERALISYANIVLALFRIPVPDEDRLRIGTLVVDLSPGARTFSPVSTWIFTLLRRSARRPIPTALSIKHDDLRLSNILLDPTSGEVTGIIDWEYHSVQPSVLVAEYPWWLNCTAQEDPRFSSSTNWWLSTIEECHHYRSMFEQPAPLSSMGDAKAKTFAFIHPFYLTYNVLLHTLLCYPNGLFLAPTDLTLPSHLAVIQNSQRVASFGSYVEDWASVISDKCTPKPSIADLGRLHGGIWTAASALTFYATPYTMADIAAQPNSQPPETEKGDPRSQEEQDVDAKLAERLSIMIEESNERVVPLTKMVRQKIEQFEALKPEDRSEDQLIKEVRPLLEQAEKVLYETNGAVQGADPDKRLTNQAKRNMQDHKATPQEQRLAEALKVTIEEVQGTIEWARDKLDSYPKAKKDLGPLLDALGQPLTQIVGGVGLLLSGVLGLLGNLLSGLGLNSLLKGIFAATGLQQIYKGLGLDKWLNYVPFTLLPIHYRHARSLPRLPPAHNHIRSHNHQIPQHLYTRSHHIQLTSRNLMPLHRDLRSTSSRFDENDISNFDPTQYVREHPDLRSPIWSMRPSLLSLEGLEDRIKLLEQQTNALFTSVKESNKFIWGAIVRPEQYAHMSPSSYSPGSIQEAIILLLNNGKSWRETDGAVEWIRGKL
ncbi:hypothetical protein NMY22_g13880 [Coprinellus aureogranulatus]|nr:hypothetical protein NMY22_g13880 [Coprinellus aureogranulatus]